MTLLILVLQLIVVTTVLVKMVHATVKNGTIEIIVKFSILVLQLIVVTTVLVKMVHATVKKGTMEIIVN